MRVELFYVAVHSPTVLAATTDLTFTLTFSANTSYRDSAYCYGYVVNHHVLLDWHALYSL